MAVGAYLFERSPYRFSSPIMAFLSDHVFVDAQATSDLLGNIAGSIITVTSITITLMLLIVQQSASNMTSQVFDQFLRRRSNQMYFGFFVGLAVYTLVTLATVDEPFNPVFAASLAFVLTVIALFLLIILFYSTIHQMRPPVIIAAIHDHTLQAREKQADLIRRTRRKPLLSAAAAHPVHATHHGFVTGIDLRVLEEMLRKIERPAEVEILVQIGSFVAYQDMIARVRADDLEDADWAANQTRKAIHLEQSRDLDKDPAYGVQQLEIIAWTVTSTAKSNLAPGMQTVYSMRDLLARWSESEEREKEDDLLPVVYNDDVLSGLIGSLGSLLVVSAESREHQIATEIFITFASLFDGLPSSLQQVVDETVRPGDAMSGIARQCSVRYSALVAANPQIDDPNLIVNGQTIYIPDGTGSGSSGIPVTGGSVYIVQRGDSLSSIAGRFGISVGALAGANPGVSQSQPIYPGMRLTLPQGAERVPTASITPAYGVVGTKVTLSATGYRANQPVVVGFGPAGKSTYTLETTTTDANGALYRTYAIPDWPDVTGQDGQYVFYVGRADEPDTFTLSSPFQLTGTGNLAGIPMTGTPVYVVQQGDTLSAIAERYGTTVASLLAANPAVGSAEIIYTGQRLRLPMESTHSGPTVYLSTQVAKPGDPLQVRAVNFPAHAGVDVRIARRGQPYAGVRDGQVDDVGEVRTQIEVPATANPGETWLVTVMTTDRVNGTRAVSQPVLIRR